MDSEASGKQTPNINIDISGDAADSDNTGANKNTMNLESSNERRVGYSKEELMKYAEQPFWVRLRNILFASFWIMWISILALAVGYVINSPGCIKQASAANVTSTTPLPSISSGGP